MNVNRYAAIILAAGMSTRLGRFKPLLSVGDQTMTDRVISIFQKNGIDTILVTGWRNEELLAGIAMKNATVVYNPDFKEGMFTSVRAGLKSLKTDCLAVFLMPVDIPLVRPFTIHRILDIARNQHNKIIYPVFGRKRGHPPLIPTTLVSDILKMSKDITLRDALKKYESAAIEVSVPDGNILFDVDSPEDYEKLLEQLERYGIPTKEECKIALKNVIGISPELLRHSYKVAQIALVIARSLLKVGIRLNMEAVYAGALLHDIAKGQPNHAYAGACILQELGFSGIDDIVAMHMNLPANLQAVPLENKIVYLADKYVKGRRLVPLEQHFESSIRRFGNINDVKNKIGLRLCQTMAVRMEIEEMISSSIWDKLVKNKNVKAIL